MEEKNFTATTTATEGVKLYFRHCGTTAALPADDLADYHHSTPDCKCKVHFHQEEAMKT